MKFKNCGLAIFLLLLFPSALFAAIEDCQKPLELALGGNVKMRFCAIPADSHDYYVGAFYMGQFEVTQSQFKAVMGYEPWKNSDGSLKSKIKEGDNYPAVYLTMNDILQFMTKLSTMDKNGATYRLPTKFEWKHATRGDSMTLFYWGHYFDKNFVHCRSNTIGIAEYPKEVASCPMPPSEEFPYGYCANGFGLMNTVGNVWEVTKGASSSNFIFLMGSSLYGNERFMYTNYDGILLEKNQEPYSDSVGIRILREL